MNEDLAVEIESRVNEVEGKKGIRAAVKKVCQGEGRDQLCPVLPTDLGINQRIR